MSLPHQPQMRQRPPPGPAGRASMGLLFLVLLLLVAGCAPAPTASPPSHSAAPRPGSTVRLTSQPAVGTTWQWQLTGLPVDRAAEAEMYDIDLFDNGARTVAALHAQGRFVVCYLSAGSWEDWRPDADLFPASVLGNDYEGWPGERWLDIRQIDLLAPIMRARLDLCRAKGFDGVEPDNVDGYANDTGFALTYEDQLAYNRWLADEAHARGLSIGLKNDAEQVSDLLTCFDWALTEDCFAQGWCSEVAPFVEAGKAVFAAEYTDELTVDRFLNGVCPQAEALGLSAILKDRDLDAWRRVCP